MSIQRHHGVGRQGEPFGKVGGSERRCALHLAKSVRLAPNVRQVRLDFSQDYCPHSDHLPIIAGALLEGLHASSDLTVFVYWMEFRDSVHRTQLSRSHEYDEGKRTWSQKADQHHWTTDFPEVKDCTCRSACRISCPLHKHKCRL